MEVVQYWNLFLCRSLIEMSLQQPDVEKGKMEEAKEAERLARVKSSMTKEDLAELTRATEELRLKQETPDSPEALKAVPSLALSDIPKKSAIIPIEVRLEILQLSVFWQQSSC